MVPLIVPGVFPPVGLSMHAGTDVFERHTALSLHLGLFSWEQNVLRMGGWHTYSHTGLPLKSICWEQNVLHSFQQGRGTVHAQHYINCTDTECSHSVQSFDNACMVHVYTIVLSFWGKL